MKEQIDKREDDTYSPKRERGTQRHENERRSARAWQWQRWLTREWHDRRPIEMDSLRVWSSSSFSRTKDWDPTWWEEWSSLWQDIHVCSFVSNACARQGEWTKHERFLRRILKKRKVFDERNQRSLLPTEENNRHFHVDHPAGRMKMTDDGKSTEDRVEIDSCQGDNDQHIVET